MSAAKMRRGIFMKVMTSMVITILVLGNLGQYIEKMILEKNLQHQIDETKSCLVTQEKLIQGTPFAIERKEAGDTVRYTVTPTVKKEILMFVPVQ